MWEVWKENISKNNWRQVKLKMNKIKEFFKDHEEIYFAFGFLVFFVVLQISTN